MAEEYGVTLLGDIPLARSIREDADSGQPTVVRDPDGPIGQRYREIARRVAAKLFAQGQGLQSGLPENRHPVVDAADAATAEGYPPAVHRCGPAMSIKPDRWIQEMAQSHGLIEPFVPGQVRRNGGGRVISFGTSSYGYDVRCADEFKIFTNINSAIVDPKNFDDSSFVDVQADVCIIPPNSFALARTVEYFRIPRNILTICLGKSTYARCGIIVNVTPLEPEWEGHVTLEFSNTTPLPAKDLRQRGGRAGPVLRVRRGMRSVLPGPRREIHDAARSHAAKGMIPAPGFLQGRQRGHGDGGSASASRAAPAAGRARL